MAEERTARELLRSKRQEMDSVQSMINKVKNAISVEDIGGRVCIQLSFSTNSLMRNLSDPFEFVSFYATMLIFFN